MNILEIVIVVIVLIVVIVIMAKWRKKEPPHKHNWIFIHSYKDGLSEYGKFYCSGCLVQGITYFNSRKGIIELTTYQVEKVIKED